MAEKRWSLQDAKNRFSAVVEAAKERPQIVTKRGVPQVVIVSVDEFKRLSAGAPRRSFIEHLLAIPKGKDEPFERMNFALRDAEL
jgi:antitoxin Phd